MTAVAKEGDSLTMGNQAIVLWAPRPPHRECADMDLRQQVTQHLEPWPVPFTWIPSHRNVSEATSAEDCEAIRCNDEVDKWAKIATSLPLPPYGPAALRTLRCHTIQCSNSFVDVL